MGARERHEMSQSDPDFGPSRIGLDLRHAREHLGWSLASVAEHLRIRPAYLQGIEDGRTEDLPGPAYAVGFVRAYAKVLGLDQDDIARRFRAEAGEVNRTELSFPAPVPDRGIPALAVVAVGAILVVGAYTAWYRMSGSDRPGPDAVQAIPEHLTPLVADRPAPPPEALRVLPQEPQVAALLPDMPSVSPSSAAAAVAPPNLLPAMPPALAAPPADGSRIVVRARGDAWIQVKDGHGQLLLNRTMRVGETWPVPPRPIAGGVSALLLTTGNAAATEVLVDGVTTGPLGSDGVVRRDLPLDAEAIRDGKLTANVAAAFRVSPRNQ